MIQALLLLASIPPDRSQPTQEQATGYDVSIRASTSQVKTYDAPDRDSLDTTEVSSFSEGPSVHSLTNSSSIAFSN